MTIVPKESDVVRACLEYLKGWGWHVWRQNTGAVASTYKGKTRFVRFGIKGAADITGWDRRGRRVEVECKAGKNKPTAEQLAFLEALRKDGGFACVVWSLDDLIREMRNDGGAP
jgi:hypothetical protein